MWLKQVHSTLSTSNMCCSNHVWRSFWNFHSVRFSAQLQRQRTARVLGTMHCYCTLHSSTIRQCRACKAKMARSTAGWYWAPPAVMSRFTEDVWRRKKKQKTKKNRASPFLLVSHLTSEPHTQAWSLSNIAQTTSVLLICMCNSHLTVYSYSMWSSCTKRLQWRQQFFFSLP